MSEYKFSRKPIKVSYVKTKFRHIHTSIPAEGTESIISRLEKVESRSMHGQIPIIWAKANDFNIFDIADNCFIDFTSTIFVTNVGHSNKEVSAAIEKVTSQTLYSCYAYPNQMRAEYLERLIEFAGDPLNKAFLLSAGTEATEGVLKLMRMNAEKIKKRRRGIICFEGNWHGRTLGAQLMSGNKSQKKWIGFDDKDIHHLPFPYPWALKDLSPKDFLLKEIDNLVSKGISLEKDICGFMLETFQGWGAIFYPYEFVQSIKEICESNNILLAFDEMQSGFGRTGKNFGFEHYGVKPDLIACGKGMGGGVPLSGVLGRKELLDLPEVGNMSSTHSANPLVCSAGLAVLNELSSKNLVKASEEKGKYLHNLLNQLRKKYPKNITYIFGKGLIASIIVRSTNKSFSDGEFASIISQSCYQKGLLVVHTGRESIKIGPPLTISLEALNEGVGVIDEVFEEILKN